MMNKSDCLCSLGLSCRRLGCLHTIGIVLITLLFNTCGAEVVDVQTTTYEKTRNSIADIRKPIIISENVSFCESFCQILEYGLIVASE